MLTNRIEAYSAGYDSAIPTPHTVIDGFFRSDFIDPLASQFPPLEQMAKIFREPMSYKGQTSDIANKAPAFASVFETLQSAEFIAQLEVVTGIKSLLPDPVLAGGGLHQSPSSGFLDLHVDANFHPIDKTLHRRLNLIVYVSPGWDDAWGGHFELWSARGKKPDRRIHSIPPRYNRAVIFNTTRTSWHGVAPVRSPAGQSRKSLALFYYTKERPAEETYVDSSSIWANRSVAWKRAIYPVMNCSIAALKPYAKHLRRKNKFDAAL
jgi:Rps23 Pro-64 3,4-dihydroxylase Tpa1-like proline 4-hydroxylase